MTAFVLALARAWARLYTRGLPAALRDARRAEIDSDLWEQCQDERGRGRRRLTTLHVLDRVIRGVPADLAWRLEQRARRGPARRRRMAAAIRRHRWTVFPVLVELFYLTGAARVGTPDFVDAPEQLAMVAGAAAILTGTVLLWRGTRPVVGAWLVCIGALAPAFTIARSVPLSLLWAFLAMRSAVRRADAVRAEHQQIAPA